MLTGYRWISIKQIGWVYRGGVVNIISIKPSELSDQILFKPVNSDSTS